MYKLNQYEAEPVDKCGAPDDYYQDLLAKVLELRQKVAGNNTGKVLNPDDPRFLFDENAPVSPGDSFKP